MKLRRPSFLILFIFYIYVGTFAWADSDTKLTTKQIQEREEIGKCYAIAHRVCPNAVEIEKCLVIKRNAFTSFCVDKIKEKSGKLKKMTKAPDVSKCTQSLSKKCQLELPPAQIRPNKKLLQAAVAKLQQCMNEKILKDKNCDAAKNRYAKKGAKKNAKKGGQVQLIDN